jgi:hypothetical protein
MQILERQQFSEEKPGIYKAEFDIQDLKSLNDILMLMEFVSQLDKKDRQLVFIIFDGRLVKEHVALAQLLECYANSLQYPDYHTYCWPAEMINEESFCFGPMPLFNPCRKLGAPLYDRDQPCLYIDRIQAKAIEKGISLCPHFSQSNWQEKVTQCISSNKDKLDKLSTLGGKGGEYPLNSVPSREFGDSELCAAE